MLSSELGLRVSEVRSVYIPRMWGDLILPNLAVATFFDCGAIILGVGSALVSILGAKKISR